MNQSLFAKYRIPFKYFEVQSKKFHNGTDTNVQYLEMNSQASG